MENAGLFYSLVFVELLKKFIKKDQNPHDCCKLKKTKDSLKSSLQVFNVLDTSFLKNTVLIQAILWSVKAKPYLKKILKL